MDWRTWQRAQGLDLASKFLRSQSNWAVTGCDWATDGRESWLQHPTRPTGSTASVSVPGTAGHPQMSLVHFLTGRSCSGVLHNIRQVVNVVADLCIIRMCVVSPQSSSPRSMTFTFDVSINSRMRHKGQCNGGERYSKFIIYNHRHPLFCCLVCLISFFLSPTECSKKCERRIQQKGKTQDVHWEETARSWVRIPELYPVHTQWWGWSAQWLTYPSW